MKLDIWHIDGRGFHFGRQGLGLEATHAWFCSDSLLSAVLARLAELFGPQRVADVAASLGQDRPAFGLTSALPRAGSVRLFPRPLDGSVAPAGDTDHKALKRLVFLSEEAFRRRLNGETLSAILGTAGGKSLQGGQVWVDPADVAGLPAAVRRDGVLWALEKRPRVTVDRVHASSTLYHAGRVSYADACGLWVGIAWHDRTHQDIVEAALQELGHSGLGGERSAGFGTAAITASGPIDLPDPNANGQWVNLGRYWPRPDEIGALSGDQVAYGIVSVGGWVGSVAYRGQRRKTIRLISEGARLQFVPRAMPGRFDDVRPQYASTTNAHLHPVWRGGPIVAVGLKAEAV